MRKNDDKHIEIENRPAKEVPTPVRLVFLDPPSVFEISPKFLFFNATEAVIGQKSNLRKNDRGGSKNTILIQVDL